MLQNMQNAINWLNDLNFIFFLSHEARRMEGWGKGEGVTHGRSLLKWPFIKKVCSFVCKLWNFFLIIIKNDEIGTRNTRTHMSLKTNNPFYCYETINHFKSFRCCLMRRYVFDEKLASQETFHANAHYSSKEMKKTSVTFDSWSNIMAPSLLCLWTSFVRHVQSRKKHSRTNTSLFNHKNLHFFSTQYQVRIFQRGIRNALKCLSEIKNKHLCDIVKQWKCVVLLLLAFTTTTREL